MFPDGVKTIEDTQARAILPNGPPLYEIDYRAILIQYNVSESRKKMNYIFWIQVTQQHFDAFFLSFVTIVFLYDVGFLHSKLSEEHYFENWVRNCRIVVRLGLKNFKNREIVAANQSFV